MALPREKGMIIQMVAKIGARAHDYGRKPPRELLTQIAADGWQSVQLAYTKAISGVSDVSDITTKLVEQTKSGLARSGLEVGVLGAYVELGAVSERLRTAEVDKFILQLSIAAKLGAGCIGSETTAFNKQPQATPKEAMAALRRSLCQILPVAQSLGVMVAVEPVYYHTLSSVELAAALIKDMQSPNLKIIFDPVNLLIPIQLQSQYELWERALYLIGEQIVAVHIKGAKLIEGRMVSCLLEESSADMPAVFSALRRLPQPITVFREEAIPSRAGSDLEFIRSML